MVDPDIAEEEAKLTKERLLEKLRREEVFRMLSLCEYWTLAEVGFILWRDSFDSARIWLLIFNADF